jgi:hypothetical protein
MLLQLLAHHQSNATNKSLEKLCGNKLLQLERIVVVQHLTHHLFIAKYHQKQPYN